MEILFMLLVAAVSLLLSVALPMAALLRASRLSSEVAALRSRLASIEEHLRELSWAPGRPATTGEARAVAAEPPQGTDERPVAPLDAVPPVPEPVQTRNDAAPLVPVPLPVPPAIADVPVEMPTPIGGSDAPRATAGSAGEATGLEEAIGGRLLLYVGTIVLVLGAAFFLKYAFD